ncbi:cilia- and flagella-associated protein 69-like [Chelonus insularis]|uniref:cilia- and flagella-associated protein 69-like n=1 Tax=Chelonus insularis TaxID=460826 RepID=UPI00158CB1F8|nr:cilia- and flagella-associated protein 69-like [Chelonus insularis]
MKSKPKTVHSRSRNTHALESMQQFIDKHVKNDIDCNIQRLYELVIDPITQENKEWIIRLLKDILREIGSTGYKVKHLPAMMQILEFITWKCHDTPEYNIYLNNLLRICAYTPLLERYSENLTCSEILDHYFSVLGYLAVILSDHNDVKVLDVLDQLLTIQKSINIAEVKQDIIHQSVERSKLPIVLTELLMICSSKIYKNVLDTTYVVTSISNTCCHKMLAAGVLNYLLSRLIELSDDQVNISLDDDKINIIVVTTNILWLLMKSIMPPERLPDSLKSLPPPSPSAMRMIVFCKNSNSKLHMIRNDLTAIILAGLIGLPSLPLVNFDLSDDIIKVAVMKDTQYVEDVFFRKTLLLIICQFSKFDKLIPIMIEYRVIEYILQLLENFNTNIKAPYLIPYALQTLTFVVPKMSDEFVKYKGSSKLLKVVEWNMTADINSKDTLESVKTILSIVTSNSPIVITDFLEANAVEILYQFIENISSITPLTLCHQKIVTILIIIIETLFMGNKKVVEYYGEQMITISVKIIERYLYTERKNFVIDNKLLIAIASCMWECTTCYPTLIENFIRMQGLHLTLDVIEQADRHVQHIYLGLLIDLCSNPLCIPYIYSWKGTDKSNGVMSLLTKLWREEEKKIGVKRTPEGCIEDLELPIMGTIQWEKSFISKTDQDYSPAIANMIGSVRPKVYSIRKILLNNANLSEPTNEHYETLHHLSVENSITFCIVDQFFRFVQGQVWAEVLRYMRQAGVIPVGTDGEMLLVMRQRHRQCAAYVQKRQEKILREVKRQEMMKEQEEFNKIRDIIYIDVLKKLQDIDYIRRTADKEYRMNKKKK